jgi:hypothetical protein
VFLWYNAGGESGSDLQWKRTFSPQYNSGIYSKPTLEYFITSPLSSAGQVKNAAPGPFWRRYPIDGDIANSFQLMNYICHLLF